MAKTAVMRLVELMILKEDIDQVLAYLGKKAIFQFQSKLDDSVQSEENPSKEIFDKLQLIRSYLKIDDLFEYTIEPILPIEDSFKKASEIIGIIDQLQERDVKAQEELKKLKDAYTEASSFANLKVSYGQLEHLSFLTMRIGKLDPAAFDDLQFALGERAILVPLGDDKTKIMAAASRKARFALDTELKRFGFVPLEVPKDFKGVPDDMLEGLKNQIVDAEKVIKSIEEERDSFAKTHKDDLLNLLQIFSVGSQVYAVKSKLESTQLVYRVSGWIPEYESDIFVKELDDLAEGRVSVRQYKPEEIASVKQGREQVPVKLKHGKFVKSFENIIFSYGAPKYGTIDPTPFVAVFFTILFGIMFGDAGQGLVLLLIGVLLHFKLIKIKGWNRYGLIFIAIGCSSSIMGLLTGEFFANADLLKPFGLWLTGLFVGKENAFAPVLHLMPSSETITIVFIFFGFTLSVGFVINSIGLVINFINNISQKKWGHAFFGKTGLSGALFFWYVIILAIRIAAFKHPISVFDWVFIGLTLVGIFFAHPLENLVDGHRPIFENGFGSALIEGIVEVMEVVSSYLSNTVSFLRVGAFALSHAVLGYIIYTMNNLVGGVGGIAISVIGNVIVIVLEGMIVAIQVIRLQYYEFFSKFFSETGREFKPFEFKYSK